MRKTTLLLLCSSGFVLMAVLALYWKRRKNSMVGHHATLPLPVLDISEYRVLLIEEEIQCETFFKQKLEQSSQNQFVGLDCEWVSYQRNQELSCGREQESVTICPVALLQLAFPDKECALVRLSKIGTVTHSLARLLTDKGCLKFGVGVLNDAARLAKGYNITPAGCVDLRNVALRCGIRNDTSLAGLTRQLTGYDLIKSYEITCSDWEQFQLTTDQLLYAARDAIAGLVIFEKLVTQKLSQKKDQQKPVSIFDEEGKACAMSLCHGVTDLEFKDQYRNATSVSQFHRRDSRTSAYNTRQTPLYHNCQLLAPDGTLLSTVDMKKVDWYLSKGLGVLESKDPPVLRLLFEPSGKPNKDREYYLTEKENICVACGRSDTYIRKNVVPHEYRKFFPPKMKEHLSHDVLLLCVNCHQISSCHDGLLRKQLALEYSVPLEASTQKYHEDSDKVKLRSLARAIAKDHGKLPESRRREIMQELADHFSCQPEEVSDDMIQELQTMETKSCNSDYVSHGEQIVRAVERNGELLEFQRRWRQHFLDTMQPQYMPKLWSVSHNPHS